MAHCKQEDLSDLKPVLIQMRALAGLKELKKGIFYLKSKGFLHFHIKDGKRWADIRNGKNWGEQVEVPFNCSKSLQLSFLAEVKKRYKNTMLALGVKQ